MEKLSSILAPSPRVKSVDMSDAKPRRPGAPSFGVPMGSTSSIRDRVNISGAVPQEAAQESVTYRNPKDFKTAKMAEEVTRKFFDTRLKSDELEGPRSEMVSESLGQSLEDIQRAPAPEVIMEQPSSKQPLE